MNESKVDASMLSKISKKDTSTKKNIEAFYKARNEMFKANADI